MLAIRMQRTGRKGHAQFRVIVQEARRSPSSGNIIASLGNYDPHTKQVSLDTEKAGYFLEHGAQPSPRVAMLLKAQGVKLPKWVLLDSSKKKSIKHVEKLRRNRPASEEPKPAEAVNETKTEEVASEEVQPTAEPAAVEEVATSEEKPEVEAVTEASSEEAKEQTSPEDKPESETEEPDIEKVAEETGDDKIIETKPEAEA